jgi:sulfur-oxidizing protein SoxX
MHRRRSGADAASVIVRVATAGFATAVAWPMCMAVAADTEAEAIVARSFARASADEIATRLAQDETQALCSRARNQPSPDVTARILELQRALPVRLPADGRLLGDWKAGEKLASIGTGGHIGRIQPDPPDRRRGGNCYACHQLAPGEVAAGNLGPSLTGYGRLHGTSPEAVRFTYEKVWNAQAWFPCSSMPRFGHNGWLTPEEVAQAVGFLLDPESPVNRAPPPK